MTTNTPTTESTNAELTPPSTSPLTEARVADAPRTATNPFVGLRPFNTDESLLFFGRRQQTVELMQQLHRTHFIGVVGSSGCGKSSLIRAGLIPNLKAGFLVEDRAQWRVAVMKPGDAPLRNLATALDPAGETESLTDAIRTGGAQTILETLSPALADSDTNLLLLVDQFEEIFRFGIESGNADRRAEAADFVSIMLALAEQRTLPIYVVMTMRSDFLGDCDNFYGLPEALNRSQYLVPRLTRQQRRQAIEGPIRLFHASISPRLLDRVLNDVGDQSDQLPVTQHALMRTWELWQSETAQHSNPEIDLRHYEGIGGLENALARDAERAMEEIKPEELKLTRQLFQALTDIDGKNRRIRRPVRLSELSKITQTSPERILAVIDHFCSKSRSFLQISSNIEDDPIIDISHESLIRQWARLQIWTDEEKASREVYLNLVKDALDKASPWRGARLQRALSWKSESSPTESWAARYYPEPQGKYREFDVAMRFLKKSDYQRRIRHFAFVLSILFAITIVMSALLELEAEKQKEIRNKMTETQQLELSKLNTAASITGAGMQKAVERKYDQAIELYLQAIQVKSDYDAAHYNLGIAYKEKGDKENAITAFNNVLQFTKDEQMRIEAGIKLEQIMPSKNPQLSSVDTDIRADHINGMFSGDKDTRIKSTTELIRGWRNDQDLIPLVIQKAMDNRDNRSGVINTLVVLENVSPKYLQENRAIIIKLLEAVESNGPQTATHVEKIYDILDPAILLLPGPVR